MRGNMILSFIRPATVAGENRRAFNTQATPLASLFSSIISVQLLKDTNTTPLTRLASFITVLRNANLLIVEMR